MPAGRTTPREPDIAVVIPTYRRRDLLPRALAALERQTLPAARFEVQVVDNASDDGTHALAMELAAASPLRVCVRRIEVNRGPAQARNLGWRGSVAPFVAFLDDDCVPEPTWLEAALRTLAADDTLGVVQGTTRKPEGAALGDWTLFREVTGPTPYFEGCNIFYRREALEVTGGFDESIGWYGEDTALGWAVLEKGWQRGFAGDAVVLHDVVERGLGWHLKNAYLSGNLVGIAERYPDFAAAAFWRPWAFQRHDFLFALGVAGIAMTPWRHPWRFPAFLLMVPWYRVRRPPPRHHRWVALLAERAAVDAGVLAGMAVASVRNRRIVV